MMGFFAGLFLGIIIGFLIGVKCLTDTIRKQEREIEKLKKEKENGTL